MTRPLDVVKCRACGKRLVFLPTAAGRLMPVDFDSWDRTAAFDAARGHVSHFATCPQADRFRKVGQRVKALRAARAAGSVSRETVPENSPTDPLNSRGEP